MQRQPRIGPEHTHGDGSGLKHLVHVDLEFRLDFRTGACRGRNNYYKESSLIDVSDGGCKFTYQQDRDLFVAGVFDNHVRDQACVVEPLR